MTLPSKQRSKLERTTFDSVSQLLSSAISVGAGTVFNAKQFSYVEVVSDEDLTTANGVKLQVLTPDAEAFGAIPDNSTDSTVAIQSFFDAISARDVGEAKISGRFKVSSQINYGTDETTPATKYIAGRFALSATQPMDAVLAIQNCTSTRWDHLSLTGTGGVSFSGRTVKVGISLKECGRSSFQSITCDNFAFAGVAAYAGNNSFIDYGNVKVTDCGSGAVGYSLTGNWSNPVNSGSSGSTSQRTVLDVDQLPPDYIIDGTFGSVNDTPYMVRIDGRLHYITSVDENNSKITVFPWVKSTATPGAFEYHFGGGVYLRGADCNVASFNQVDGIRCSTPLAATSLYGPHAKRITSQVCGSGLVIGRTTNGASLGGNYQNCYFENNSEDIILVMRADTNAYNYFHGDYALNLAKCYCVGNPRLSSDGFSTTYEQFNSQIFTSSGRVYSYEKKSNNATSSSTSISVNRSDQVRVHRQNTSVFNIGAFPTEHNRLTGIDSMQLIVLGTGANDVPTGTVTFNPPTDWTVNGTTSVAFSSFTVPPHFVIFYDVANTNVIVRKLN